MGIIDLHFGIKHASRPWPSLEVKCSKNPYFGAWMGIFKPNAQNINIVYFRNYCTDSDHILDSDNDHQILLVGGPNTRKTNPRWQTAAILKKIKNRPYFRNGLTHRHQIWHYDAYCASKPDRPLKFRIFENARWRTAAILKIGKWPYLRNGLTDRHQMWPLNELVLASGLR